MSEKPLSASVDNRPCGCAARKQISGKVIHRRTETELLIPREPGQQLGPQVVTAARFVAELYAALARGRPLGEAVSLARKHLAANPQREVAFD
ncbi:MAG: hypothetical protein JOY71_21585, partial [Acetobacteraceae bacterium]|nr:hypothetical protein [Acetobacteraceae bacterium]